MVSNEPLVSVIVPSFNAENHIRSTIESVLLQSYNNYEIIIVDDNSTDNTRMIASEFASYSSKIHLIHLTENSGTPARPRNVGVMYANGDWVAFLDADDLWHPQKLSLQISLLNESKMLMCSSSMIDFIDESKISHKNIPKKIESTEIHFKSQLIKYLTPTSSIVLQRDIALQYPFPEDIKYRGREDFACMLKVHESIHKSIKIMIPLIYYRKHNIQISRNKVKMAEKQLLILKEFQFKNGRKLGLKVYVYICGHILLSFYYRMFGNKL